jgi:hypothetical protein
MFDLGSAPIAPRVYGGVLTVVENRKGVLDADTVKGCTRGMAAYPVGGCYGACYAAKTARQYGIDFTVSVSRRIHGREHRGTLIRMMNDSPAAWYRVGTAGDPSHDWSGTLASLRALRHAKKTPVIVTKHWASLTDDEIDSLRELGAVVNTSVSALDTDAELAHRLRQRERLMAGGVGSVLRVVTCDFASAGMRDRQDGLLAMGPVIDNPLRVPADHPLVESGRVALTRRRGSVGGGKSVSLHKPTVFIGRCSDCPDQCGVTSKGGAVAQKELFAHEVVFKYVPSVIGSGYEQDVATLALEDGIAHRAARKNMQIHSAIILLVDGAFAGFMTFQVNDEVREFCLLQSVIKPALHTPDLYRRMVKAVLERADQCGYPCFMTTDPKSKFETPELFESLGFETYLKMSGFHYMCRGSEADYRLKILAHITMTNVWDSTRGKWLELKKKWREKIEATGAALNIPNPMFASRDGCWQGTNGFANVVTGHAHNGNASVLDTLACEVILRFFMPREGRRVYNPFGGGVQFGYVAGSYGYEYVASEIRKNQCDANNVLCQFLPGVKWVQADSSTYQPEGMFDLVFTCPPYYKVEKYLDYDGKPPAGELNSMGTYEQFRDTLFAGYAKAIEHLNDGCFFVVMTGDSRDSKGAYHCSEAETELFLRDHGLSIYNRIVYLEGEFTRLAQAKVTLNTRKFPKREQKIIVAYKGNTDKIGERFAKVGRL